MYKYNIYANIYIVFGSRSYLKSLNTPLRVRLTGNVWDKEHFSFFLFFHLFVLLIVLAITRIVHYSGSIFLVKKGKCSRKLALAVFQTTREK